MDAKTDRKFMARALKPHVSYGMELKGVGERDGKPTAVLISKRRYDGEHYSWEAPLKPEEVAKDAKYVARLLSLQAREDMENSHEERRIKDVVPPT